MFMGKVIGSVTATKKEETLRGHKLLVVRPMLIDEQDPAQFRPGPNTIVAVDSVGAGEGSMVIFCQGSSARQAEGLKTVPVDASIVGIIDSVEVLNKRIYPDAK